MAQNKLSRNKRTAAAQTAAKSQYEHTKENRVRKLMKHLRKQPNDMQAKEALEK